MKKLKTIKISNVKVSLYLWDCKKEEDIMRMRKRFPKQFKRKGLEAFKEEHSGFFMTETKVEWVIAINLSGKKNPLRNALPHEIGHMSDVVADALGQELIESSELRSTLLGDTYEELSEVLEKELQK